MSQKVAIVGAGGHAREVLDVLDACAAGGAALDVLGFLVDGRFGEVGQLVNGLPILGDLGWLAAHRDVELLCGIGAPEVRQRETASALALGARFFTAVHPRVERARGVSIAEGCVIPAGCILGNNVKLGRHVHFNLGCTVGHDSVLGDFATLSPGVHLAGNVRIDEGSSIGTGANIIEKLRVGAWSVVGAGSTVIRGLPANCTAVGSPARVIKQRQPGWHSAP